MNMDKPWQVEQRGIELVPQSERHGTTRELFYIWFAANIGFLGLLYGAVILAYKLTFWQGIIAAIIGCTSFLLVGVLGIGGKNTGAPMLILARRAFGWRGNVIPSLVCWVNLLGWETIIWITATDAIVSMFQSAFGIHLNLIATTIVFLILGVFTFLVAIYGHATVAKVQKWISLIFGISTCAVIAELLMHHQVHIPHQATSGSFTQGFLPAVALIILGTGLSWATTSSDYTRYLPSSTSSFRITLTTFIGAALPLFGIIVAGMLLTPAIPALATSTNPLFELGNGLPVFWVILFWITAAAGLLTENILAIYSSGLTLITMHIRMARPRTAIIEFFLTGAAGLYFLVSNSPFIGTFETFLGLIGSTLAPWAGILLLDMWFSKNKNDVEDFKEFSTVQERFAFVRGHIHGFSIPGLIAWLMGVIATLLFASSPIWTGSLANTIIGTTQLGFLVGFIVSGMMYFILYCVMPERVRITSKNKQLTQ